MDVLQPGSVPPTTTVAPRTTAGSNFPVSTCEKERNGTAPGGPAKSIQALFSGNVDGSSVCPSARSAATTGNVSSFAIRYGNRRITPSASGM